MLCQLHNRFYDILGYTFDGKKATFGYKDEISLNEFLYVAILTTVIFLCVSWWVIPIRIILSPLDKIKFRCKKE